MLFQTLTVTLLEFLLYENVILYGLPTLFNFLINVEMS